MSPFFGTCLSILLFFSSKRPFLLCQGGSLRRLQQLQDDLEPATVFLVPCPGSTCTATEASFQDGICGCAVLNVFLQDGICDCPNCADEEAFTCDSCIPTEPFFTAPVATQTDLGVAVGVSLGVAVGVGLGIGLGISSAVGAAFAAVGFVQFIVSNAQESCLAKFFNCS